MCGVGATLAKGISRRGVIIAGRSVLIGGVVAFPVPTAFAHVDAVVGFGKLAADKATTARFALSAILGAALRRGGGVGWKEGWCWRWG